MTRFSKTLAVALCALALVATAFAMVACMHDNHEADDIADLFRDGYECTMQDFDEYSWVGLFEKDGSYYKVTASMSKAQAEALAGLDLLDEDYNAKLRSLLETFTVLSCQDMASQIPAQKDMDKWVGKTIGDVEKAGLEQNGSWCTGDEAGFTYSDGTIVYGMDVDGTFADDRWDSMSADERAKLVISRVYFAGFDWGILE